MPLLKLIKTVPQTSCAATSKNNLLANIFFTDYCFTYDNNIYNVSISKFYFTCVERNEKRWLEFKTFATRIADGTCGDVLRYVEYNAVYNIVHPGCNNVDKVTAFDW